MGTMTLQTATRTQLDYSVRLNSLIEQLQSRVIQTPEAVKNIVEDAQLTSADLMPWADFDHPVQDSYGRKLVFDGGHFEVMVMSWVPGDFSAIHDHGGTQWGAVQCFGTAEHYTYHFNGNTLTHHEAAPYSPGMVRAVDHNLIHQMGNSSEEAFLSLHVYGNGAAKGNITGNARIFELYEETIQYTDGGVFYCLQESDINRRISRVRGDRISTRRHHQQMRERIRRILSQKDSRVLQQKLNTLEQYLQQI